MLAVTTQRALSLIDASSLKRGAIPVIPTCELPAEATSSTWASDNSSLFISTAAGIYKHDPSSGGSLEAVNSTASGQPNPVSCIVSKDQGQTLIFSREESIYAIETRSSKVLQTFNTHRTAVVSLSLSNDNTLLASATTKAVHIHDLVKPSHSVLRGLPTGEITTCIFHPHFRTRLLLGVGSDLVIYDTAKPSAPSKAIAMDRQKGDPGNIVAISCSPFSKTFAAVACRNGYLNFLDIEKQKALYNPMEVEASPTSMVFSPEGVMLYVGTENGKIVVVDLRALDKGPRAITVSETGEKIASMCIQKKLKAEEMQSTAAASTTDKPLTQKDVNKDPISALTSRKVSAGKAPEAKDKDKPKINLLSPTARIAPKTSPSALVGRARLSGGNVASPTTRRVVSATAKSPSSRKVSGGIIKNVSSPARPAVSRRPTAVAAAAGDESDKSEGLGFSEHMNNLLAVPKPTRKENLGPAEGEPISSVSAALARASRRTRAPSSSGARTSNAEPAPSKLRLDTTAPARSSSRSSAPSKARAGAGSGTSRAQAESGRASSSSGAAPSRSGSGSAARTPSPDLPGIDDGRESPVLAGRKGKARAGLSVLGLGTPEVKRWVREGPHSDDDVDGGHRKQGESGQDDEDPAALPRVLTEDGVGDRGERASVMAVQVSPRRLPAGGADAWAAVPSPLRGARLTPPGGSPARAQEFLQSVLRDAMHEFRQETRAEFVGLHLDVIRMGRGWEREMRAAMGEWRDEMRALREENGRLREQNEVLKRGY